MHDGPMKILIADKFETVGRDVPDEGVGGTEMRRLQRRGRHPLERGGDPFLGIGHALVSSSSSSSSNSE